MITILKKKEREIETLKLNKANDLVRLYDLRAKYKEVEAQVHRERRKQEARAFAKEMDEKRNAAARKIQGAWRRYYNKKLASKPKKKGGKKKKKGNTSPTRGSAKSPTRTASPSKRNVSPKRNESPLRGTTGLQNSSSKSPPKNRSSSNGRNSSPPKSTK